MAALKVFPLIAGFEQFDYEILRGFTELLRYMGLLFSPNLEIFLAINTSTIFSAPPFFLILTGEFNHICTWLLKVVPKFVDALSTF